MSRRWTLLLLACAGCSDVFSLPLAGGDMGHGIATDHDMGGVVSDGGVTLVDGGPVLPASCAKLDCTPATMEGDVTLASGNVSGCHAYDRLTITVSVAASQYFACANTIYIAGTLDANGGGDGPELGVGAGGACAGASGASGGGHGGRGADPGNCGGGVPFDDTQLPRKPGSGGGGDAGGVGGGVIELSCSSLNLLTLIRADGLDGDGDSGGGGAGGSVLIEADSVLGTGRIEALGGRGVGTNGGGGGGGRVAIHATTNSARFDIDVSGGASSTGSAGATGSIQQ